MQAAIAEGGLRDDHSTIRSAAGLVPGARFQGVGIKQGNAGAAAVSDQNLPVVSDGACHARKSRQGRKVLAGIVVDHLDAIAGGVCNEDTPAPRIEGGVIELAARGAGMAMVPIVFRGMTTSQRPRVMCRAENNRGIGDKKSGPGFVHAQSPRTSSVAQSLDGKGRLMGSLHVPGSVKLSDESVPARSRVRAAEYQCRHDQRQAGKQK